jgi:hypothetical protein
MYFINMKHKDNNLHKRLAIYHGRNDRIPQKDKHIPEQDY